MGRVRHSVSAENDLLEAWLFVAEDSVEAADRLLDQIQAETRTLLLQPRMGRARDELVVGLRSWPTSMPYILFYFVEDEGMTVARVLHYARDVPAIWNWPRHREDAW